jgi:hypothetical protein
MGDSKSVQESVREAWLSILGVINSAESEVKKTTTRLLESLGIAAQDGAEPHESLVAELMARVRRNREEFERRIDEGVKTAVARVRAPIDKEIATLRSRLEQLGQKLDKRPGKSAAKEPPKPKPKEDGE